MIEKDYEFEATVLVPVVVKGKLKVVASKADSPDRERHNFQHTIEMWRSGYNGEGDGLVKSAEVSEVVAVGDKSFDRDPWKMLNSYLKESFQTLEFDPQKFCLVDPS